MKVLIGIGGDFRQLGPSGDPDVSDSPEFDWLEPGELVHCGINATYSRPTFCGSSSLKHATRAVVAEMDDPAMWLRVSPAADNMRALCADPWLAAAVNFDRWLHEAETLWRQASRYPIGLVVVRTDDGLDIKEAK